MASVNTARLKNLIYFGLKVGASEGGSEGGRDGGRERIAVFVLKNTIVFHFMKCCTANMVTFYCLSCTWEITNSLGSVSSLALIFQENIILSTGEWMNN